MRDDVGPGETKARRVVAEGAAAARVMRPGEIRIEPLDLPRPGAGEVQIRLEGCGVCASNLGPWAGPEWMSFPLEPGALGHEGWGRIADVGPGVIDFGPGDRVAFLGSHGYATHENVAASAVLPLPPTLDHRPFPAEPLGCAMNILRRSGIREGDVVAIVGVGFLGALLTRLAVDAGAQVIAISRRHEALDIAARAGAAHIVPMDDHARIIETVGGLTGGRLCDVVIEAAGYQWPLDLSAELVREGGRLVVAGYHQDGPRQVNMQMWNWKGIDVVNAHERDPQVQMEGMRAAVEAVVRGRIDPDPLYTHVYPLDRLAEALDATRDKPDGFVKALVACV